MNVTANSDLVKLLSVLYEKNGVDFTQYKETTLRRRIESRLRRHNCSSYKEYIAYIEKNEKEIELLIDSITINVTEFFRNPEIFDALNNVVIPQVLLSKRENKHKIIKVWSCACSKGDEPYSLAIMLSEKLGNALQKYIVRIIGSDIDDIALDEAKKMIYSGERVKGLPRQLLDKYFEKNLDSKYKISKKISDLVTFKHLDMIKDKPILHCDIIMCRNILIYFKKELQEEILLKLSECLNPGGFLILGMVESLVGTASKIFENVDNKLRIYRKPLDKVSGTGEILSQNAIDNIVKQILEE